MHKVLITGGTKGIGLAVAEVLLSETTELWLTYSNDEANAQAVQKRLQTEYPHAVIHVVRSDIRYSGSAYQLVKRMQEYGFTPDVVVLNAGITSRKSPFETSTEEWSEVFQGNVHYPMELVKGLVPTMPAGGVFIFTGSLMAVHPHSMSLSYGVTKSAVHALVSNLVKHLEPFGLRVAGVAPGFVETEWQQAKPTEIRKSIENKVAQHRFATPKEVASVFKMVVDNAYFNGDIVSLSGGYSYK